MARAVGIGKDRGGVARAVEALPRPWGRCQVRGGVAKAVEGLPRPWGRC